MAPRCRTLAPVQIVSGQPETANVDGTVIMSDMVLRYAIEWGQSHTLTLQLSNLAIITLHVLASCCLTIGGVDGRATFEHMQIKLWNKSLCAVSNICLAYYVVSYVFTSRVTHTE